MSVEPAPEPKDTRAEAVPQADEQTAEKPGAGQPPPKSKPRRSRSKHSFWRELPVLIVVALVLALVIKTYLVQPFFIPSGSMQNTLAIGDRVLVNKVVYHLRGVARGDIVVFNGDGSWNPEPPPGSSNPVAKFFDDIRSIAGFSENDDTYIKRVIGLPGDHVICCDAKGQITVNGAPLSESSYLYPGNGPSNQAFNITVPKGRLWVMGDHRAISADSRYHMDDPGDGTIPESAVLGRAFVVIWPPSQWGFLNIPATFGQSKLTAAAAAAAGGGLPVAFGFAGAIPVTLLRRSARRRLSARRRARR
ncbi:MAG TPA: signal peptidase I [Trebonia sp.]|jgi:signal peptidase I|nr:signal peptidase I [Trebonia sp.]